LRDICADEFRLRSDAEKTGVAAGRVVADVSHDIQESSWIRHDLSSVMVKNVMADRRATISTPILRPRNKSPVATL
jgi:hypothetical protein